ncbi:hypothetical protein [Komagataeibacter kakiaceti]|uniref:hypothetical protein n=1 Tax=Komagataeibacter kakiaceti TaxID=943261 RepID=UPI0019021013|nr:hypothetical protein [Komagataeibacter kakiaceti]
MRLIGMALCRAAAEFAPVHKPGCFYVHEIPVCLLAEVVVMEVIQEDATLSELKSFPKHEANRTRNVICKGSHYMTDILIYCRSCKGNVEDIVRSDGNHDPIRDRQQVKGIFRTNVAIKSWTSKSFFI